MPFLGHIVGRRGLECEPKKIEDVKVWPIPDCLRSVRQFLGFVGYYRRFVPGFADLAEPLVALTGKDVPFVWRTGLHDGIHQLTGCACPGSSFGLPRRDWTLHLGHGC